MAVMVGNAPDTTVVPLASSTLLTNLPLSHSVGARFKGDCQSRGIQDSGFVNKYPGSSELDADVKDP